MQEAALIGLEKLDAFQPGTNFTGWMVRIVRNVARNHARRETRRSGPQLDEALHEQDQGRQPVRQDAPGT